MFNQAASPAFGYAHVERWRVSADKRQQARVNIAYFHVYPDTKEACLNLSELAAGVAQRTRIFETFIFQLPVRWQSPSGLVVFSNWDILLIFLFHSTI
jgi:hypothetical protein